MRTVVVGDATDEPAPRIGPIGHLQRDVVVPAPLRWEDGDWRIAPGRGGDYHGLQAPPGSPEAAAAGWLDFVS